VPAAGDVVTPFAFGAKGDGATDDTAALQATIDAATTERCLIDLLAASYRVTDTLAFTNPTTTAGRPSAATVGAGASMFDTTLNKPIWSTGSGWVDATGAAV